MKNYMAFCHIITPNRPLYSNPEFYKYRFKDAKPLLLETPDEYTWYENKDFFDLWKSEYHANYKKGLDNCIVFRLTITCQECEGKGGSEEEISGGEKKIEECSNCFGTGIDPERLEIIEKNNKMSHCDLKLPRSSWGWVECSSINYRFS